MATLKRKSLPLSDRVQAISLSEKGTSARKIAQQFGMGKTQIQSIILNEQSILQEIEDGVPAEKKRKMRRTGNERINELMYEWFKTARLMYIPLLGSLLQEKGLLFEASDGAELLGLLTKAESMMERELYQQGSTARQATLDECFDTN